MAKKFTNWYLILTFGEFCGKDEMNEILTRQGESGDSEKFSLKREGWAEPK